MLQGSSSLEIPTQLRVFKSGQLIGCIDKRFEVCVC
jgi:hypothetical protein